MHFTLAQIRAFQSIVQLGSFRAAADALGVTQPSISQRVRELEAALDAKLFVRNGPQIALTAAGHTLVPHATQVLRAVGEIVECFQTHDPPRGMLRLGVTDGFALVALSDMLQRLEKRYPALRTSVCVHDGGTMSRLLNNCELDIGLLPEPEVEDHVRREPIGRNELAWFAGTTGSRRFGTMTPSELVSHHLVVNAPPSRLYNIASKWFRKHKVEPDRLSHCNSLAVTMRTVISGHAIGLLPTRFMRPEIERGEAQQLTVVPPVSSLDMYICYHQGELGEGIRAIVDLSLQVIADHELFV